MTQWLARAPFRFVLNTLLSLQSCVIFAFQLEGALGFTSTFHIGGELVDKSVKSCRVNLDGVLVKNNLRIAPAMDVIQWDVVKAGCLRDNSVDVVISDLPFGRRSGSKLDNRKLYPDTLLSLARLVRPNTGRAVLLTQDKTSMFQILPKVAKFWSNFMVELTLWAISYSL